MSEPPCACVWACPQPYKLEILESIVERDPDAPITIYHIGDRWWDLCAGPHVEHTGLLPSEAISLESIAGAYWRGDESKAMLQRIYGACATAWRCDDAWRRGRATRHGRTPLAACTSPRAPRRVPLAARSAPHAIPAHSPPRAPP